MINTGSRRAYAMVVGGFTSSLSSSLWTPWFVNLPVRFQLARERIVNHGTFCGKQTYKSTTKAEATREEWKPREQDASSIPMTLSPVNRDEEENKFFVKGPQQIRISH